MSFRTIRSFVRETGACGKEGTCVPCGRGLPKSVSEYVGRSPR